MRARSSREGRKGEAGGSERFSLSARLAPRAWPPRGSAADAKLAEAYLCQTNGGSIETDDGTPRSSSMPPAPPCASRPGSDLEVASATPTALDHVAHRR